MKLPENMLRDLTSLEELVIKDNLRLNHVPYNFFKIEFSNLLHIITVDFSRNRILRIDRDMISRDVLPFLLGRFEMVVSYFNS